jgi:predicted lipid-binding transport protein (Tim44 family)
MKALVFGLLAALAGALLVTPDADAKRLGGAGSLGAQRNVTPPPAAPAAQNQAAKPAPGGAPQAQAPAPSGNRWLPLLGGLAIGGLLGSLFGGSALGGILLLALLAAGVAVLVAVLMRARGAPAQPLQYAGLGSETVAAPPPSQSVQLDEPSGGAWRANVPPGFDAAGFVRAAKLNFIRLQEANDKGDLATLRELTTPQMADALAEQLRSGGPQHTDVVTLDADLLEVVTEGDAHHASLRFRGMMRESPGAEPAGFEEIWNLVKPLDDSSGWLLAGIQQLH